MSSLIISPQTEKNLREENQDAFGHFDTPYGSLLVVCDGMGGGKAGHEAADYTCTRLPQLLNTLADEGLHPKEALRRAVNDINSRIYELATSGDPAYHRMGTTLVFALETAGGFIIGHVGDSRAYLHHHGHLRLLTADHAPVSEMVAMGMITPEQGMTHPRRSILSRAIGAAIDTELDIREEHIKLAPGDNLILCSDGLSGFVLDPQIENTLNQINNPREASDALLKLAMQKGSDDNITILLAHREGPLPAAIARPKQSPERPLPLGSVARPRNAPKTGATVLDHSPPHREAPPKIAVTTQKTPKPPPKVSRETVPISSPSSSEQTSLTRPKVWAILLLAALLLSTLTVLHYYVFFHVSSYKPNGDDPEEVSRLDEGEEPVIPTEVERLSDYGWETMDCPISLAESAKSMLGSFDMELRQSTSISTQKEIDLGIKYAADFEKLYPNKIDQKPQWLDYLRKLSEVLIPHLDRPEITYTIHHVNDPTENAFALPGGHIYIFQGLIDLHLQNEAQLIFVLAHEMAHVDARHAIAYERLMEKLPGNVHEKTGGFLQGILRHPFSMTHEEEADFLALKMVLQTEYAPTQSVPFLESLAAKQNGGATPKPKAQSNSPFDIITNELTDLISTHPNIDRRICQLRNQIIFLYQSKYGDPPRYVGTTNFNQRLPFSEAVY